MARKNKVRIDRIIILILVGLLIGGLVGFGISKLVDVFTSDSNKDNKQTTVVENSSDEVLLSLNDYTIYYDDTNELGFNFIVADINFTSNKPVSFALNNLQTSEKIFLNDISKYLNKLDLAGFDLSKLDINTTGIVSENNSVNAKILIPYTTDASSLAIYNSVDTTNNINIDLSKTPVAATSLKLSDNSEEIVVGSTSVYVSKAYISTFMMHNDEPYETGLNQKIYSYEISVKQVNEKVKITDAIFILKDTSEEIHCKESSYKSIDMDNILDTYLSIDSKGGLFFEVYSNEDVVQDGTLLIKFSNSNDWFEVSTNS